MDFRGEVGIARGRPLMGSSILLVCRYLTQIISRELQPRQYQEVVQ